MPFIIKAILATIGVIVLVWISNEIIKKFAPIDSDTLIPTITIRRDIVGCLTLTILLIMCGLITYFS